jgi:hypothetical protein
MNPLTERRTSRGATELRSQGERGMTQRRFRTPAMNIAKSEQAKEEPSQQYHPDTGPYLLQIDGQTKRSFRTSEAAHSAALELKTRFPVLHVSIFDTPRDLRTVVNERSRSQS